MSLEKGSVADAALEAASRTATATVPPQKPTVGRIVHVVLAEGAIRPAIVVQVWPSEMGKANLQVFTDGGNDIQHVAPQERLQPVVWRTSVDYDETGRVGTWHWPPRA